MLPLGSGRLARVLAALCWAAALACLAVWLQARAAVGSSWLVVPLACVLGAGLGWSLAAPLRGLLVWNGHAWLLQASPHAGPQPLSRLRLSVDLGPMVMLRADGAAWCLVTQGQAGAQWHALQLALRHGRSGQETTQASRHDLQALR